MSKVSVIVPVFNTGNKLNRCIQSILDQTFADFELILVNDGSTDNSLKVCSKYKNRDSRIVLIDKENEGSIATRNKGVNVAKSDYIMFVDADDWIDKTTIEMLYSNVIKNDLDIVVCNFYKVLGNGKFIKRKNQSKYFIEDKLYSEEEIRNELVVAFLHGHPFPSSLFAKLYKKELLISSGKYLDRIRFLGDDLFYNLELFINAKKVKVIHNPLYFYRLGGNTSKYMPQLFNDMVNGYEIQKEVIEEYFKDTKQKRYNGISVMLLNTFKTSLYNLFISSFSEEEIKQFISEYLENKSIMESIENEYSLEYFSKKYLNAIKNKDIHYLYNLGLDIYKKSKPKMLIKKLVSKIAVV